MKPLALLLLLTLLPVPAARAQASLDDIVRLEVLDGGPTDRGTYQAAFRLTLADGWKTYWRAPGEAGIPPEFTWSGAGNVGAVALTWPTPHVFDQNGMRSIGYKGQLVLAAEVTPKRAGQPLRLSGDLQIGVCSDVCVPATLHFDHTADPAAGRNPAIAAALASRPYSASEARVTSARCSLRPGADGMRLTVDLAMPSTGGDEVVVIEPGTPAVHASQTTAQRRGGTLSATSDLVHEGGLAFALDRSAVRITVLGARHAVDIQGCSAG